MTVSGRTALVTAGQSGVGLAVARALTRAGAGVVLVDRDEDVLRDAAERLGPSTSWVAGDIADPETAFRAVGRAARRHGGLDLVVACEDVRSYGAVGTQPLDEARRMVEATLYGTIVLVSAAAPAMAERDGSAVVVVTSSAGAAPVAGLGVYGGVHAALRHMVPVWALELGPQRTRVNAVCAGLPDALARPSGTGAGRWAPVEKIVGPVLALLDGPPPGDRVTGAVLDLDLDRDRADAAHPPRVRPAV